MTNPHNAPRHLHTLDTYSRDRLIALLDTADELRNQRTLTTLRGKSIVLLFLNPSLRTRVSMELAAKQLGADVVTLEAGAGLWKLEFDDHVIMRGDSVEHVKEAVRVLARYGDLLGVRAFPQRQSWAADAKDPVFSAFMQHSTVPVLNLESCLYHPCQSAADLLTIRRFTAGLYDDATHPDRVARSGTPGRGDGWHGQAGTEKISTSQSDARPLARASADPPRSENNPGKILLTWADHPKSLPVAVPNSFALAVTQMGWDLTIARPQGYDLPPEITTLCQTYAARNNSKLEITDNREAAFSGAKFVYAKSWGSLDFYGEDTAEIEHRKKTGLSRWCVDTHSMARTDNAYFMHCLPVRRNVVVTDEVIDGPRSIVADQAENRLHIQKALLLDLFNTL